MQMKNILLLVLFVCCHTAKAQVRVLHPRIENLENPIGLDVTQPRFGWQLAAERRNVLQTAYEVQVAANAAELQAGKKLLWSSGKTMSDVSIWVSYNGPALQAGKKY